jgi:hypothetical protein
MSIGAASTGPNWQDFASCSSAVAGACHDRWAGLGRTIAPGGSVGGQPSAPSAVRSQRTLDPGSFPCSGRLHSKHYPPFSGPRKSPTAAGIRATGLGFGERNVPLDCSPNADLSPELGAWPIYSTSFFASGFSGLASFATRKVGIPFACLVRRRLPPTAVDTAPTQHNEHYCPVTGELDDAPRP